MTRTNTNVIDALRRVLKEFEPDSGIDAPTEVQKAVYLARRLQQRATELQTPQEKRQQAELDRMLQNPSDKATLIEITDQAFRSKAHHRAVDQLTHILDVQGVPRFFGGIDRTLLKGFQSFGAFLPGVAAPLVKDRMQRETANVVLPAEKEMLAEHLDARRDEGVRMNVNVLGEALLGEEEAQRRLKGYLQALQWPQIEVVSVKISTIYSQISTLAREHTIGVLCDRMELLYRAAAKSTFERADGTVVPKFVYLDMEEYRDMWLTAEVFMRTLDRPGMENVGAGIALQAYVPDSFLVQQRINKWARGRATPITIRVVKGANMEMERVEASLFGWPQAPYRSKIDTDANYKRMLREGMKAENRDAVRLGIASHNLFDVAYGLVLTIEHDALESVQFEMLEGMANHQRRALFELANNVLLYAPACRQEDFIHAIGYLIRRLDENTGPENFLRHAFMISVGSDEWQQLESGFVRSAIEDSVSFEPRRNQDRSGFESQAEQSDWRCFTNEADTDFSLHTNSQWAQRVIEKWKSVRGVKIPSVIAGEESSGGGSGSCMDPSRPDVEIGVYFKAHENDVDRAVACAMKDPDGWRSMSHADRSGVLRETANEIRKSRGDLMGAAMADGGKTFAESDPEVSEAVDFVEFYRLTAGELFSSDTIEAKPKGVIVVAPPWNFPIAIPCGGIAAALAAGNTVILKPAPQTVLTAYELCQCFWRGGVSKNVLQFVSCDDMPAGQRLVTHDTIDVVILTGGTDTALHLLSVKPDLNLLAETGGKNATIVTAMSDRDQAIKHVVQSAFGHSGQKCSATSLLILEEEVFDDEHFKRTLCDAVKSIHVGSAWELHNKMGPMIGAPPPKLESALKELEPGESWAVMPKRLENNANLFSPGVKWNVQPDSVTHTTEFFGPVLGVMKAKNLQEAIALVNATGFGLTSGLQSLDDREQQEWLDQIRAGNLYINRGTTGAIVLRQPFGGMGKSAFGPGIKAGGPNYVAQLMDFVDANEPEIEKIVDENLRELRRSLQALDFSSSEFSSQGLQKTVAAIGSYDHWVQAEFAVKHDHFRLIGQDNFRRYLPVMRLRIRVHADDSLFEVFARVCAARAVGCRATVSVPVDFESPAVQLLDELTQSWAGDIEFVEESDEQLADAIREEQTDRIRYASPDRVPHVIRRAVATTGIYIADVPVLCEGRIELLWYVREQSICIDYHRYGNLGKRSGEQRARTL